MALFSLIAATLDRARATVDLLARGDAATPQGRVARRNLQHGTLVLLRAYDASVGASARHRAAAEAMWLINHAYLSLTGVASVTRREKGRTSGFV